MTSTPLAVSFDCTPPENASKIQKSLTKSPFSTQLNLFLAKAVAEVGQAKS